MKAPLLRKGKTKSLLESSIDCALLAVEIYNKPRAPFQGRVFYNAYDHGLDSSISSTF